ncbi:MAG: U32 family peptidase [Actinomycetes bacterium]|nr:U32 family peptidase [Actinomycetes bacterium]
MELLAPAGEKNAFLAALGSGADAVYLGAGDFNARRGAANFSITDLPELCARAHVFGSAVYLTVNTLVLDREFADALALVDAAAAAGVDAFIVADPGLIDTLARTRPDLRLHASTQMNAHASDTIRALADLGVARVTLARELSLRNIQTLTAVAHDCGVQVECFAHGAICVCYSGQCLLSSLVGRRSANRGLCAQPCRLAYDLVDHRGQQLPTRGDYPLSPADLALIDHVRELADAGVDSIKIEGRMKSATYVTTVVSEYRSALNEVREPVEEGSSSTSSHPTLTDAFNRRLTTGYFTGRDNVDLMDYSRTKNPTTRARQQALAARADDVVAAAENYREPLHFRVRMLLGRPLTVTVTDSRGRTGSYTGPEVQPARTKAVTADEVREHIGRLGGTFYRMEDCEVELDDGVGIGFAALHAARRDAIAGLLTVKSDEGGSAGIRNCLSGGAQRNPDSMLYPDGTHDRPQGGKRARKAARPLSPDVIAVVGSLSAARSALNAGADEAHIDAALLLDAEPQRGIVPVLPRIAHDDELDELYGICERFGTAVASTLGQLATLWARNIPAQAHWSLNVLNTYSVAALDAHYAPTRVWLSPELSGRQIADIAAGSPVPVGIAVMGQQEVMVTESCVLRALDLPRPCTRKCGECPRRKLHLALRDRKGYCFPVRVDARSRSHIYNSVPLDLTAALDEVVAAGVSAVRLDMECALNTAASREVARLRRNLIEVAAGRPPVPHPTAAITKGHFFRGLI